METGWRERERRLRGAGSLQGQGSGVGSTGPGDTQRSGLGLSEVRAELGQQEFRKAEEVTNYVYMGFGRC